MCRFSSCRLAAALLLICFAAMVSAKLAPWELTFEYKGSSPSDLGVYKMCGDHVCGKPILKLGTCTKRGCPLGDRCNGCTAKLLNVGSQLDDLPEFYNKDKTLGRYGLQFDDQSCPFLTFGSDFRSANRDWFEREGWIAGCKPRVSCRARGGKKCRGSDPVFDVAVDAYYGYTAYYGLGNAVSLGECIAGGQGGGVPVGEVLGVDCDDRGI